MMQIDPSLEFMPMVAAEFDNPIWLALRTDQSSFAIGGAHALRYHAEVAPFIAIESGSAQARLEAAQLAERGEELYFVGVAPADFSGWTVLDSSHIIQMLWTRSVLPPPPQGMSVLTIADVPAMLELTARVFPGFFRRRTIELGRYYGVYRNGVLAAMAGERMRAAGFQELSAVCTHPDHVGQGLAARLSAHVIAGALERGVQPFLHVGSANARAQSLYQRLGFKARATLPLWQVRKD